MWLFFGYLSKKRSLSTSLAPRNIGTYAIFLRHLLSQASVDDACLRLIYVIYMRKFSKRKKKFRIPFKYTKLLLQRLVIPFC